MDTQLKAIKAALDFALVDCRGVTALEYGIIAATTIAVGMAAFAAIGTSLAAIFAQFSIGLLG